MALVARTTTWIAGDELTATALNTEFDGLYNVLRGVTAKNIKVTYDNTDIPTAELISSVASGTALRLSVNAAGGKALSVHDGAQEVASINEDGDAVLVDITSTGTIAAPTLNLSGVATVGTILSTNNGMTKQEKIDVSGSITWDADLGSYLKIRLNGNGTLENMTNWKTGGVYLLEVRQNSPGGHTLAWGTAYETPYADWGGGDPIITSTALSTDLFLLIASATNEIFVFTLGQDIN